MSFPSFFAAVSIAWHAWFACRCRETPPDHRQHRDQTAQTLILRTATALILRTSSYISQAFLREHWPSHWQLHSGPGDSDLKCWADQGDEERGRDLQRGIRLVAADPASPFIVGPVLIVLQRLVLGSDSDHNQDARDVSRGDSSLLSGRKASESLSSLRS